ncbi:MAG: hypothetical protein ACLUXK_00090 [[Ruminococcus] torques]
MLYYRTLELNQIEDFWKLLNTLDAETDYMMYEPNERTQTTNVQELKNDIENNVICGSDFFTSGNGKSKNGWLYSGRTGKV